MSPELLEKILTALTGAGFCGVVIALMKRPTEKDANEIARQKMLVEQDELERKQALDRRDEDRKRAQERDAEIKSLKEERAVLVTENDRLRAERNEAREELAARKFACNGAGNPCKADTLTLALKDANRTTGADKKG